MSDVAMMAEAASGRVSCRSCESVVTKVADIDGGTGGADQQMVWMEDLNKRRRGKGL